MTTEVSVVIPTLRERANLEQLLPRLFAILRQADIEAEVIVVDDNSQDGTYHLCSLLSAHHALRLITRREARGLASAVLCGLQESAGAICVVMDADLSHPPVAVPDLIHSIRSPFWEGALSTKMAIATVPVACKPPSVMT